MSSWINLPFIARHIEAALATAVLASMLTPSLSNAQPPGHLEQRSPRDAVAATRAEVDQGKAIAFDRGKGNCIACHEIAGGKLVGTIGPPLVNVKARYPNRDLLFKRVWDETQFNRMTVMPPFGRHKILTEDEVNRVVDFLYTL